MLQHAPLKTSENQRGFEHVSLKMCTKNFKEFRILAANVLIQMLQKVQPLEELELASPARPAELSTKQMSLVCLTCFFLSLAFLENLLGIFVLGFFEEKDPGCCLYVWF